MLLIFAFNSQANQEPCCCVFLLVISTADILDGQWRNLNRLHIEKRREFTVQAKIEQSLWLFFVYNQSSSPSKKFGSISKIWAMFCSWKNRGSWTPASHLLIVLCDVLISFAHSLCERCLSSNISLKIFLNSLFIWIY